MIIYNETYVMDELIREEWLDWMKTQQIPAILRTGWFKSYKILSVLDSPNEGVTYCVQFITDKREDYNYFKNKHANWFHQLHSQKFENRYVLFNTLMELIEEK
jgi:hypothetical protein